MLEPSDFDWNQMRSFLATVEEGSLSGAARKLGLTQPTLSRQIAALEVALDVVLFERVGKRLHPTPTALDLAEEGAAMTEAATRVALIASGQSQSIAGRVRITCSDMAAAHYLPPIVAEIREAAPLIELEIIASDDIRDLQAREADIAIRHVRPTEPELIAQALPERSAHFYAATRYLDRRGRPESLAALRDHDIISPGDPDRLIGYMAQLGVEIDRSLCRILTDDGPTAWSLVRQGLGITPMDDKIALATPDVEAILPEVLTVVFPVWLATHRELQTSRRIRLVYDLVLEGLRAQSSPDFRPSI